MTVEEIIANVHLRTDRRAENNQLNMQAELLKVIQDFCKKYDWYWARKTAALTTSANTSTYDLKTATGSTINDFWRVAERDLPVYQNGSYIGVLTPEFDVLNQEDLKASTTASTPSQYFFAGSATTIEINKPDGVYTIRIPYRAVPKIPSGELTETVPLVPEDLHGLLQDGLEVRVLRWLLGENSAKYLAAKGEYDNDVRSAAVGNVFGPGKVTEWRNQDARDAVQST